MKKQPQPAIKQASQFSGHVGLFVAALVLATPAQASERPLYDLILRANSVLVNYTLLAFDEVSDLCQGDTLRIINISGAPQVVWIGVADSSQDQGIFDPILDTETLTVST